MIKKAINILFFQIKNMFNNYKKLKIKKKKEY